MESLDVYLNGVRAGRLDDDNGMLSFAYCDSFLANGGREPLSHSLPLRTAAFVHTAPCRNLCAGPLRNIPLNATT